MGIWKKDIYDIKILFAHTIILFIFKVIENLTKLSNIFVCEDATQMSRYKEWVNKTVSDTCS